eukprot:CAMPEP_0201670204 /NCGR_PEP_ID=MMETSP0494-20130426/26080_1 /ASSEMBLY_ACC=CAM_ASM_000839 /TAXON_ID=420259 /ORGANISM="Thalassiosira gravida, Strain GMp14c1" /LENGTH=36 /DNA_ID= /DNA_START= /DNA_END= /DNA_ORIENTATION=
MVPSPQSSAVGGGVLDIRSSLGKTRWWFVPTAVGGY